MPEAKLHEQVNVEWSFVETHRYLLFASDAWLGNAVLEGTRKAQSGRLRALGRMPTRDDLRTLALDDLLAATR